MDNGFQPPVVYAEFRHHSGVFLAPEMYADDYEDTLLEITERQEEGFGGSILIKDTSGNTHMVDLEQLAHVYCSSFTAPKNNNTTFGVDVYYDDFYDEDDDFWP